MRRREARPLGVLGASLVLLAVELAASLAQPAQAQTQKQEGEGEPPHEAVEGMTLEELFDYAREHSPLLREARARLATGQAAIEAASLTLPYNPELNVAFGAAELGAAAQLRLEVELAQTFEIAGERGLRIEAAERFRELTQAEFREVEWEVHLLAHLAYYDVLVARLRVATAEQALASSQELLWIAERRVEAGEESPLSLLVGQAELAQARQELILAARVRDEASLLLAEVVGWPAETPLEVAGEVESPVSPPDLDELVGLALENHPQYRTSALAVALAEANFDLEEAEASIDPTIGLAYEREEEDPETLDVGLVTVGIPIPLWNRNQGGRARADAELEIARAQEERLRSTLRIQVARSLLALQAATARIEVYAVDVLPAFTRNLELIRRAFELGAVDLIEVSQTRERIFETQASAIEALGDYYQALGELEALIGTEVVP